MVQPQENIVQVADHSDRVLAWIVVLNLVSSVDGEPSKHPASARLSDEQVMENLEQHKYARFRLVWIKNKKAIM